MLKIFICINKKPSTLRSTEPLNICKIVVIGGDGSLTGADLFRQEWPSLLQDLVDQSKISSEQRSSHLHLNIVGLVNLVINSFSTQVHFCFFDLK